MHVYVLPASGLDTRHVVAMMRDDEGEQLYLVLTDDDTAYEYCEPDRTIRAPRGYRWSADVYGLRLVHIASGAYCHPTSADLLSLC